MSIIYIGMIVGYLLTGLVTFRVANHFLDIADDEVIGPTGFIFSLTLWPLVVAIAALYGLYRLAIMPTPKVRRRVKADRLQREIEQAERELGMDR